MTNKELIEQITKAVLEVMESQKRESAQHLVLDKESALQKKVINGVPMYAVSIAGRVLGLSRKGLSKSRTRGRVVSVKDETGHEYASLKSLSAAASQTADPHFLADALNDFDARYERIRKSVINSYRSYGHFTRMEKGRFCERPAKPKQKPKTKYVAEIPAGYRWYTDILRDIYGIAEDCNRRTAIQNTYIGIAGQRFKETHPEETCFIAYNHRKRMLVNESAFLDFLQNNQERFEKLRNDRPANMEIEPPCLELR